ncbi:polymeric immunoglobulin receptor-like [Carassius gibelio]|uniref:polymeric immunoglobulin receptor-like n=1 Tax=Carassius gibelio TaxID=101364 RepID=UPI0022783137|nr:polymeric immunoglobulin receptor-like [Carassius gibelio]
MAAIIFKIITLCMISGKVLCFKVTGCSGGSVMFNCTYKSNDQHKGKYFCSDRDCRTGISTETQRSWVYKGRFSLYDDEDSRFFTVFIRNLGIEDKGKYTCGNNQTWRHNITLVVNKTSSSCGTSVLQTAYKGQTITFHCEYNHTFQTHTKLLYRVNRDPVLVLNSSQSSQSSEKKFILSDSHKDHFNVTIRDISAADDGVYLCGVEIYGPSKKITHITFIKEIHLNVSGFPVTAVVSVGLVRLALCLVLMLLKVKHRRKHDVISSDRRETGDHETEQEEIQVSDPGSTPLYSTVQLPTIPSDELLYTAVSFQKHEESLSEATVRFSEEEIHCEYTSVNYSITPN